MDLISYNTGVFVIFGFTFVQQGISSILKSNQLLRLWQILSEDDPNWRN